MSPYLCAWPTKLQHYSGSSATWSIVLLVSPYCSLKIRNSFQPCIKKKLTSPSIIDRLKIIVVRHYYIAGLITIWTTGKRPRITLFRCVQECDKYNCKRNLKAKTKLITGFMLQVQDFVVICPCIGIVKQQTSRPKVLARFTLRPHRLMLSKRSGLCHTEDGRY